MKKLKSTIIPEPKEQPAPPPPPPMPTPPAPPKQPGDFLRENGVLFMDKEFNQDNCMPLVKMIVEYNLYFNSCSSTNCASGCLIVEVAV